MMDAQEARNLADRIFSMTKLPECEISMNSTEDVFIRFANNGITTSGYRVDHSVSISATGPAPAASAATARCPASVVLPAPPFWLASTIVFITAPSIAETAG